MKSWIASANNASTHFPVQNLPFGACVFPDGKRACVTAIGDYVVDLAVLEKAGLICQTISEPVFDQSELNGFMALGKPVWQQVRNELVSLFSDGGDISLRDNEDLQSQVLVPMGKVKMAMPFKVAEYTDFYAGKQHAMNMGLMLRGSDELPANWLHIPIGYNGRASSVVVSGTDIHRPYGQIKKPDADMPHFGPSNRLDIELEIGAVVGTGSALGKPVSMDDAEDMIFGYVLLNDWSARDIQAWEYRPLGPFQGKAFGTSISPWVVTSMALEPFRCKTPPREKELLAYLKEHKPGLFDIHLEVSMQPEKAQSATTVCKTNYNRMYYSSVQQLCHHSASGCNMRTGDLLGSGTISGPVASEFGSLMELCWAGAKPIKLDSGETRTFIEDGDRLTLTGWAQGDGYKIGFGECSGKILPAVDIDL